MGTEVLLNESIVDEKPSRFSIVSLFSGCGGLDLGFLGGFEYRGEHYPKLPFEIIAAYDNDEKCIQTYNSNLENSAEIRDLSKRNSLGDMPQADILMGGFPCQDFSSCGPKSGLKSKRGKLYKALVKYMVKHKPILAIAENVPHLARMGQGVILQTILKDLEKAGYDFEVWSLYAPDYGVPQSRERLFLIGVRNDFQVRPVRPEITHHVYRSIDWAIGDLVNVTCESIPNQSQYFKASRAKKGNGQGDETNKPGMPSYTIRANAKSRVQFHYDLPRRLTVRECARLQTFPDNFIFPHSATTNIMQIGNAVPPLLSFHVANSMAAFLKKIKEEELRNAKHN